MPCDLKYSSICAFALSSLLGLRTSTVLLFYRGLYSSLNGFIVNICAIWSFRPLSCFWGSREGTYKLWKTGNIDLTWFGRLRELYGWMWTLI